MTAKLKEILARLVDCDVDAPRGVDGIEVRGLSHDSRRIEPGWIFVAIPGEKSDGHKFVDKAIEAGASVIIAEKPRFNGSDVVWVRVPDTRKALGPAAAALYRDPTAELTLVGITGTNGKTTLTYLLEAVLKAAGKEPGVIGTVTYRWKGSSRDAGRTTPEASDIQALFREMVDQGVTHGLIEVSSHGLNLDRLAECRFDVGVFTNLSQEHLDYHRDMEDYFRAKRTLFSSLLPASQKGNTVAIVNLDDVYGMRLKEEGAFAPVTGFGTSFDCAFRPGDLKLDATGISGEALTPKGRVRIRSGLVGGFNLMNILAAIAVAQTIGVRAESIEAGIASVENVPGRLERVPSDWGTVLVDYAHTPDAIKTVLNAVNAFRSDGSGRIITVMGCGGDRDKTKRPVMGREAAVWSDLLIVTSDNPRSEDPDSIIDQILEGVRGQGLEEWTSDAESAPPIRYYVAIRDRREAIFHAVESLGPQDILVIAGKGHETYQEIKGVRHPFDDRQTALEALESLKLNRIEAVERTAALRKASEGN